VKGASGVMQFQIPAEGVEGMRGNEELECGGESREEGKSRGGSVAGR